MELFQKLGLKVVNFGEVGLTGRLEGIIDKAKVGDADEDLPEVVSELL